jgi:DNA (cytosine-5)-methyltransferase 1
MLELQRRLQTDFGPSATTKDAHFQVLDFFSGAGGMTTGFAMVERLIPGAFKLLGAVDISEDATQSYKKNFGAHAKVRDIRTLAKKDELQKFLNEVGYDPTRPLVIIGCSPCQGFTSHRKKNWDERDSRNDLVATFARIATKLQPVCVVMENVPEMFSAKYESYYQNTKRIFERAGYTVHQKVYNTAAFGVPQERFRLLSIAMTKDFLLPEELYAKESFVTVRQAIGDLPAVAPGDRPINDAYHMSAKHKFETVKVIRSVPKDGGNRPKGIGPQCLDRVKGFSDVYGRLYWDRPSITITQYARNPASGRYVHPEQDRGLTIREAARLQSFPDTFQFSGRFDSMFKQIGEAVPPKFSCAVAASVFIELISKEPTIEQRRVQEHYTHKPVSNSYASMVSSVKELRL